MLDTVISAKVVFLEKGLGEEIVMKAFMQASAVPTQIERVFMIQSWFKIHSGT